MAKRTNILNVTGLKYDLKDGVDKTSRQIANECAKKINLEAQRVLKDPRRNVGNKYRRNWTHNTSKGRARVFNAETYRLGHLLEHGHVIAPHGRRASFWGGKPHIDPVVIEMRDKYFKNITTYINSTHVEIY